MQIRENISHIKIFTSPDQTITLRLLKHIKQYYVSCGDKLFWIRDSAYNDECDVSRNDIWNPRICFLQRTDLSSEAFLSLSCMQDVRRARGTQ